MFSQIKKLGIDANINGIAQPNHPVIFHYGLFRLELYHGIQYHQNVISKQLKRVGFEPLKIYPEGNSFMHPETPWTPGFAFIAEHIWVDNIGECNAIIEFEPDTSKVARIVLFKPLQKTNDNDCRYIAGNIETQVEYHQTLFKQLKKVLHTATQAVVKPDGKRLKYPTDAPCLVYKTMEIRPSPTALLGAENSPASLYLRTTAIKEFGESITKIRDTYELIYGFELRYIND